MKLKYRYFALFMLIAVSVYAGGKTEQKKADRKPLVAVSILPQRFFVERIGGDRVETLVLVGPGQSPHSYDPTPRQMADLARASVWILSGTDFEEGLRPKISRQFPSLVQVDGTVGVTFRVLEEHGHEDDGHDLHEEHEEHESVDDHDHLGGKDRHTWLGKTPALLLAAHVRDALSYIDPDGAHLYAASCESLCAEIETSFANLSQILAPLSGSTVLVFHPSFGYFLDEFGISQKSVETGGKEPTARALTNLIATARENGTKAIFVQAQFPVFAAKRIAKDVGARVIYLDPLAPDWLSNIESMGDELFKALK